MKITQTATLMLLATTATLAALQPANALEAQAFVDRVAAVYKHIGYDFKFGTATLDGDTVTVDGVKLGLAGMDGEDTSFATDTQLTFSGVTEREDGAYFVGSLTIPDIDAPIEAEPAGHISLVDISLDNLYIPAGDTIPASELLQLVGSISTGALLVERDGQEVISIDSMEAASTFNPEQGSDALVDLSSTLAINGIAADLSTVGEDDPAAGATIEGLGLTTITGDITQNLTWSMADGHMVMDEFLFDFADVGALNVALDASGLTPAVLDQLYAMQAAMADTTGEMTAEQQQAQMMSGMALMQGVTITSAAVRYDDASLAGKLLDFYAEQAGADRATYVEGLKSALPTILAGSGIPALNDVVIPPVEAFLDDPQSIELAVAPPSPTSLLVLMAAAANPAGLITALNLTLTANEAAE